MGYNPPPGDEIAQLFARIDDALKRITELERPTGTQVYDALAELRQLVEDLPGQINAALAIEVNTGNVNATGTVTAAVGMKSVGVYNTLLTYGGAYSSQYVHSDGTMGYVPSSIRFKTDVETYEIDIATLRELRVVQFRYIAAVERLGDDAALEIGLIAEEVDSLGVHWLVDYDPTGMPVGVKYDRLALVGVLWAQALDARMTAAGI